MLKKTLHYLWDKSFLQYFIVGCSAFVLDFLTLIFFREVLGMHPVAAVALNQILAVTYVFLLNKYWSFKSIGQTGRQMVRFFVLMMFNYLFAIVWMWFFTKHLTVNLHVELWGKTRDLWYLLVRMVNIMLSVSWNFFIYKFWVYKK